MIIVISDTHNNIDYLKKVEARHGRAEALIHCGDVTDFALLDVMSGISDSIYLVKGNGDIIDENAILHIRKNGVLFSHPPFEFSIENYGHFAIMHEPYFIEEYATKEHINYIIHGHTHRAFIEKKGNKWLFNPGALSTFLNPKPSYITLSPTPQLHHF